MVSTGSVTLVGAGPGDPELLTLKAARAIREATVLLVDDLVSDAVLALADPAARIVHVGKRGGCRSTPQAFIQKLMVSEARAGARVVRLKGGDPFIFGRGGEELACLKAAGIPATVVNGITAGLAAANALGVALTHRAHAQGVVLVTAHGREGSPGTDWPTLASAAREARLTLVIYMGVTGVQALQDGLLAGLPASMPVAVVQNASLPGERCITTTLADMASAVDRAGVTSPAIIVVGEVTRDAAQALARDLPAPRAQAG